MNRNIKEDFPLLKNSDVAYLDSSATTQKPQYVLDKVNAYYNMANANPHRGAYHLSIEATTMYEESKEKVANFINAKDKAEIIYTKNASEALNLIAYTYGMEHIKEHDKVVVSIMEHHSNIVPWQFVTKTKKGILEYLFIDKTTMQIPDDEIINKIDETTKIVAITHISNVLGVINRQVDAIIKRAHEVGAIVVLDCAQSIPHMKIDVQALDVDFIVFSGHKMLSPLGIGVLYGKKELLENMNPFLYGGDMIEYVYEQETTYGKLPNKFEAGTQNVGGAVGLSAAIEYMEEIGYEKIAKIEEDLLAYAMDKLKDMPYVTVYGVDKLEDKIGVITFNIEGVHAHDVASILDSKQVAIRAGDHCAQPLHRYLGLDATCRMSLYVYNTNEDIDKWLQGLKFTYEMFAKWNKDRDG